MTSLDECLAKLKPLIGDGDADGRALAREVMGDFVAGHPGPRERCAAMLTLEGVLTRETADLSDDGRAFAFGLIEWLDRERRTLEEPA